MRSITLEPNALTDQRAEGPNDGSSYGEPLRGELLSMDRLESLAAALAADHRAHAVRRREYELLDRLARNNRTIAAVQARCAAAVHDGQAISFAAEWVLDNAHIIQEQIREAIEDLPRRYCDELPKLVDGPHSGLPRVYAIAETLVTHTDGHLDIETLSRFVAAYQTVAPLTIGELWAVPIALRYALIESLARLAARIDGARREIDAADRLVAELLAASAEGQDTVRRTMLRLVTHRSTPSTTMFMAEMLQRLRDQDSALEPAIAWLEGRLADIGITFDDALRLERQTQAANQVSVANAITSMRTVTATDWTSFFETLSAVDTVLKDDPSGHYGAMDFATRDRYRHVVERIAKRTELQETDIAARAIDLARRAADGVGVGDRSAHVGYYLVGDGARTLEGESGFRPALAARILRFVLAHPTSIYLGSIAVVTAVALVVLLRYAVLLGASPAILAAIAIIALVPASELAIGTVNQLFTLWLSPRVLPKLDLRKGIPPDLRTIVVVPTLFASTKDVRDAFDALEIRFLGNQSQNLHFAVLSDFRDADVETLETDQTIIDEAVQLTEVLNARHGVDRFFLFHRHRLFNAIDRVWMGWERKRGKIEEFNRLLEGDPTTSFTTIAGDLTALDGVRYVITLDADTSLPPDAAARLVGAIAHPLNRPRIDQHTRRVVEGFGIVQPRVSPSLEAFSRSRFARIFSGFRGVDPYTTAVSDLYQDLFGEASFVGKGIYDRRAFRRSVDDRVPENTLLSHDLFEGSYARTALATDIELFDDYPSRYDVFTSRKHRWIRGDWQLLPWLLPFVPSRQGFTRNVLSWLSRWKILDNLRRSLVAPAVLVLLIAGWSLFPGSPLVWTAFAILVVAFPVYAHLATALMSSPERPMLSSYFRNVRLDLRANTLKTGFAIAFLPHQAWITIDAICRVVWRSLISRRRMLEWVTAAESERNRGARELVDTYIAMSPALLVSVIAAVALSRTPMLVIAPFLTAWLASPAFASWLGHAPAALRARDEAIDTPYLRVLARETWRYFEQFAGEEDHYLPPDNFQEVPSPLVAHRTSPTNIGLSLLAALTARDLGYLGLIDLLDRIDRVFATLDRLDTYEGHFFNWYDTQTLAPLSPRYVSTVDSGNLAGHLIALKQGVLGAATCPLTNSSTTHGLLDAMRAITSHRPGARGRPIAAMESLARRPHGPIGEWPLRMRSHAHAIETFDQEIGAPEYDGEEQAWRSTLDAQLVSDRRDFDTLVPWVALLTNPPLAAIQAADGLDRDGLLEGNPGLEDLRARTVRLAESVLSLPAPEDEAVREWMRALNEAVRASSAAIEACLNRIERIAAAADAFVAAMDFSFLFDKQRKLFTIGYGVDANRLDNSYYDLLASEARLASFIAIAKGDAPAEHWQRLGRTMVPASGQWSMVSWSGSMFEYMMPSLVMHSYEHTLLESALRAAVHEQIAYARRFRIPWGISECAYNARDLDRNYQYGPFGVPSLGLKRSLASDLVVAPYATLLALDRRRAATANLKRLDALGLRGRYGFYESIDFTPSRIPDGKSSVIVRAYMAHHQGMSVVALGECLLGGPMKKRFHSEPMVRAHDVLLEECHPRLLPSVELAAKTADPSVLRAVPAEVVRYFETTQASTPRLNLLGNSRYAVMLTTAGSGYSRRDNIAITRWRADVTCDNWGQFCYVRDVASGDVWSTTYQPTLTNPTDYAAIFSLEKVEYRRVDHGIEVHTTVSVSTEDDAEVRSVSVKNLTARPRTLEFTTYAEIVLAPPEADSSHPAFSKLFVQTEFVSTSGAIIATRRRRSAGEPELWAVHVSATRRGNTESVQFETDRARFLGRGRTTENPVAITEGRPLSNTAGAVLDPIVSLRRRIELAPYDEATVDFTTAYAGSREHAVFLGEKYADPSVAMRTCELAWTNAQVELRHLGISATEAHVFLRLASRVVYVNPDLRSRQDVLKANVRGQSSLWGYGISGDNPIVLLRVSELEHLPLVRQMLRAHELWRLNGLTADLVILNEHPTGYHRELHDAVLSAIRSSFGEALLDKPGGVFIRKADLIPEADRTLLLTAARAVLVGGRGTLEQQIQRHPRQLQLPPTLEPTRTGDEAGAATQPFRELEFWNGTGGFAEDGREYVIVLEHDQTTPAPWTNVLANPRFGCLVTDSGGGYTWSENSRENKLTSWSNDPVSDWPSEVVYLRDDETGAVWTPTSLPIRGSAQYVIRHSASKTVFEHTSYEIASSLTISVPEEDPVKLFRLSLTNSSLRRRRLSVFGYAELVLGVSRETNAPYVVTEIDGETGALVARNRWNAEFGNHVAFFDATPRPVAVTGERREFLGRNGTLAHPNALTRTTLAGQVGGGFDPCAVLQVNITLEPNETREVILVLGQGADIDETRSLVEKYRREGESAGAMERATAAWDSRLGTIEVRTPDRSLDILVNRWLLHQVVGCRVWARAAFYQAGGAYGFRDQLQDVAAAMLADPALAREHLLRAACRQFVEGDVQHWWHPPTGRGVRTRCSDDLLWLPLVALRYSTLTGDTGVFDEVVPFIEARQLAHDETDLYLLPELSAEKGSLFDHCTRAIDRSLLVGEHGLPFIGAGDWNDGMNNVGVEGRGESVWVGWFLASLLRQFAPLCESRGDRDRAERYREHADALVESIETHAWDGDWYVRAFFDDGTPLGSSRAEECRIDSIAQTWSVISGAAREERQNRAMASVEEYLVRRGDGLITLLTPPFDHAPLDPGYIKGYLPGVRENGGQYTHAAIWVVLAYAMLGDGDRAGELFSLLNPLNHTATHAAVHRYRAEPYVMAADVYAVPPHTGRGGWTWYTGSASWMYRVAVESILGFVKEGTRLRIDPCIPRFWHGYWIVYTHGSTRYRIEVTNPHRVCRGVTRIEVDGVQVEAIDLVDDGRERLVTVELGPGT